MATGGGFWVAAGVTDAGLPDAELPEVVLALVRQHMHSMDHVAVLLALRASPDAELRSGELASLARIDTAVTTSVLADLAASHLVAKTTAAGYRYQPSEAMRDAVDQLAEMYNSRPVTLVRAIYDRPASAVKSFADAFRIRSTGA